MFNGRTVFQGQQERCNEIRLGEIGHNNVSETMIVVLAEPRQVGEALLHAFEEVQEGLALVRQGELRPQPHVDVEVVTERRKRMSHTFSR